MFNKNGNNNGHHRNGTGNGLVHANSLPRTGYGGNGHKPDAAIVTEHDPAALGRAGTRPSSRRRSDSPSTRPSSRSARAAPGALTTTSKGTS